jgi:hypothetical protein
MVNYLNLPTLLQAAPLPPAATCALTIAIEHVLHLEQLQGGRSFALASSPNESWARTEPSEAAPLEPLLGGHGPQEKRALASCRTGWRRT